MPKLRRIEWTQTDQGYTSEHFTIRQARTALTWELWRVQPGKPAESYGTGEAEALMDRAEDFYGWVAPLASAPLRPARKPAQAPRAVAGQNSNATLVSLLRSWLNS